jgi:YihY family inner membrane protein
VDRLQRRHRVTGVAGGVLRRYSDDRAGQLAALITFYGFLSVFPLLLLLLTVVGLFLHGTAVQHDIINSALAQFPVIGARLRQNIHAVSRGNPVATAVSLLGLTWGALGVTSGMQQASHRIWRQPAAAQPGWWPRTWKGLQLLGALALIVVLSSVAAGLSTVGAQYFGGDSVLPRVLVLAGVLAVNAAGYLLVLWLLAPKPVRLATLLPGTALGAVGWSVLQALSGYLLGHQLHHASQIYGFFAVVLGLVFWIHLGVQLFLYSSELNLVVARREWPRYLFGDAEERSATT